MKLQLNLLALSMGTCLTLWSTSSQAAPAPNAGQLLQQQQQDQPLAPQPAVDVESSSAVTEPSGVQVQIPVQKN